MNLGPVVFHRRTQMEILEATRQGWSERKEVAIPTEIRYVVQWVRTPPGQSRARQAGSKALRRCG